MYLNFRRFDLPSTLRAILALGAMVAAINAAGARDLDPELRQYVISSCSEDAYRLCPQSLGNERDAVSCMKSNRAKLNRTCRSAYDKAAHSLAMR